MIEVTQVRGGEGGQGVNLSPRAMELSADHLIQSWTPRGSKLRWKETGQGTVVALREHWGADQGLQHACCCSAAQRL